jgi:chromosome segregation and condensation protein ScpB
MSIGLEQQIEALIFASIQGITIDEIHQIFQTLMPNEEVSFHDIEASLERINHKYNDPAFAISLQYINNGYHILN